MKDERSVLYLGMFSGANLVALLWGLLGSFPLWNLLLNGAAFLLCGAVGYLEATGRI